jgi:DNA invertase Pin-like site-specific DNA recombinase
MQHMALSVLCLKGTMSEAELHVLKDRLRGGILNKVRRGEYRCQLPTGFVYDELGNVTCPASPS